MTTTLWFLVSIFFAVVAAGAAIAIGAKLFRPRTPVIWVLFFLTVMMFAAFSALYAHKHQMMEQAIEDRF